MIRQSLVACLATFCAAVPTFAATYSFSASSTNVVLNPGDTTTIAIFVTETTDGFESSLFATENGLYSADVRIEQVSTTAVTPTKVLDEALDIAVNLSFSGTLPTDIEINGTTVDIAAFADLLGPGVTGVVNGNTTSIKIADVTFTAGTLGETIIQLIDNPLGDNNVTFDSSQSFDSQLPSANGPSITFTVIPEPGMLGMLGVLALTGRRRRT